MVAAKLDPEAPSAKERGAKGGRGHKAESSLAAKQLFPMVTPYGLSLARTVLAHAPDLVAGVASQTGLTKV